MSKYISSQSASGTAKVAKWGYTVDVNATQLLGEEWLRGSVRASSDTDAADVKASSAGTNLVAPGTKGSMTIEIGGSAEVLAKIQMSATINKEVKLNATISDNATPTANTATLEYSPIKWTLTKDGKFDALATGTLADVVAAFNNDNATVIEPNSAALSLKYTLSWEWVFGKEGETQVAPIMKNGENPVTDAGITADVCDTLLGELANNSSLTGGELGGATYKSWTNNNSVTEMDFAMTISVEQIQRPETTPGA